MDPPICAIVDANACIIYSLRIYIKKKLVTRNFSSSVRGFIDGCLRSDIPIGYFDTIQKEAIDNLTKAANELGRSYRLGYHKILNLKEAAGKNLRRLFNKLMWFPERCTTDEQEDAKNFFESIKKDLYDDHAPARSKDPIPEINDIKILVSAHNLEYSPTDILSEDLHFTKYSEEISRSYDVRIIDVKKLYEILPEWGWEIK